MATYGTFIDGVPLKASELNSLLKWDSYTPTVTQSNTLTRTSGGVSRYAVVNKTVFVISHSLFTNNGTASNALEISLPVTAATTTIRTVGWGYFNDLSTATIYNLVPVLSSTTTLQFLVNAGTSLTSRFGVNPAVTVAGSGTDNDALSFGIVYEAA